MKVLKVVAASMLVLALLLIALYVNYIYVQTPARPGLQGVYSEHDLQSGDHLRHFAIYRPVSLNENMPVLVVLHGSTGNADSIRKKTAYEFESLADEHQFLVVYPDGYKNHWNDCRHRADYAANRENIDDVGFMRNLFAWLVRYYPVDQQRIYMSGYSNGGQMSYRMALEAPASVAGIASFSANLPVDTNLGCSEAAVAVPVIMFAGTNDPINPYNGGKVVVFGNDSRGEVLSAQAGAEYWAGLAGATGQPLLVQHAEVDGEPLTTVVEQRWTGKAGTEIRLYTLQGSGHVIPSRLKAFPKIFGGGAGDISAPREVVDFFLHTGSAL